MIQSLLIVTISLLLDRTLSSVSLAIPIFVVIQLYLDDKTSISLAFSSGIMADLLLGRTLGLSSLLFLIIVLQNYFYTRRFDANNWWSMALLGLVAAIEARLLWRPSWRLSQLLIEVIIIVGIWFLVKWKQRWFGSTDVYLKKEENG